MRSLGISTPFRTGLVLFSIAATTTKSVLDAVGRCFESLIYIHKCRVITFCKNLVPHGLHECDVIRF